MSVLQAGGSGEDRFTGISTLSDGSVLLTGTYEAKAGFGEVTLTSEGKSDIFLSRVNSDGRFDWITRAGGAGEEAAHGLASYGDGSSLVAGYFHGDAMFGPVTQKAIGRADVFITRVDKDGEFLWSRRAGGAEYDSAEAASALADGGAIVAGYFEKEASFGSITLKAIDEYDQDGFITKVDADGQFQWAVSVSGPQLQTVRSVATLTDGSAVIAGTFTGTAKLGEFTVNSDEEWGSDAYIAKLSRDGEFEWAQRIGGSDFIRIEDISSNASNDIVIAGTFSETALFGEKSISSAGYADAFVAKFNSQGEFNWVTKAGGTGDDYGHGVTHFSDGDVLLTGGFEERANFGTTQLSAEGSSEAYAARINGRTGALEWAIQAEGSGTGQSTRGFDVSSGNDGTAAIAGYFRNNARFGQTSLRESAAGEGDGFMAMIDANGAWIESSEPVQPPVVTTPVVITPVVTTPVVTTPVVTTPVVTTPVVTTPVVTTPVVTTPPSTAPSGSDSTLTINEDTSYTFSLDDWGFSDQDRNGLVAVFITELPKQGELSLKGKPISADTLIIADHIKQLQFSPAKNTHGKNYASIEFKVKDSGTTDNGGVVLDPTANTISIDVLNVNDAPSGRNKTIRESYSHQFSGEDFGFTDTDGDQLEAVKITSLPQAGELTLRGKLVKAGDLINAGNLNQLKLTANYCGQQKSASSLSFNFKVKDNGGTKNGGTDLSPTVNIFKLNPAWKGYIQGLSKRSVSKISPDCIKSWSAQDIQKIPAKAVAGLSADQLEAITHRTSLTPEQINNVNPEAASSFNADDAKKFNANQFKALTAQHFEKLDFGFISAINCIKAKELTSRQIKAIGDNIDSLQPKSIFCLQNKTIQALTDQQAQSLTFEQYYALTDLSWKQFYTGESQWSGGWKQNRVGEIIGPITASILESFKKGEVIPFERIPETPPNYVASKFKRTNIRSNLNDQEFQNLKPDKIKELTMFDIRDLNPSAFSGITKEQVEALTPQAIRGLNTNQLKHFKKCAIASFRASQIKKLNKKQLQSLGDRVSSLNPKEMNTGMSRFQLSQLTSAQKSELTFDQVYALRHHLYHHDGYHRFPKLHKEIGFFEKAIEAAGINYQRGPNSYAKQIKWEVEEKCSVRRRKWYVVEWHPWEHYKWDSSFTYKTPKKSKDFGNDSGIKDAQRIQNNSLRARDKKYGEDPCSGNALATEWKNEKVKLTTPIGSWKLGSKNKGKSTPWINYPTIRGQLEYIPTNNVRDYYDKIDEAKDFLTNNPRDWKAPKQGIFKDFNGNQSFYDFYEKHGGSRKRSDIAAAASRQCELKIINRNKKCSGTFDDVQEHLISLRWEMEFDTWNGFMNQFYDAWEAGREFTHPEDIFGIWPEKWTKQFCSSISDYSSKY